MSNTPEHDQVAKQQTSDPHAVTPTPTAAVQPKAADLQKPTNGHDASPKGQEHKPANGNNSASPKAAEAQPKAASRLASQSDVVLPDLAVGDHQIVDVFVFNLDRDEASITAKLVGGGDGLELSSAPDRLRPSSDGFNPDSALKLSFKPTKDRVRHAEILINATFPGGHVETLRVAVTAPSHASGTATHAERDQQRKEEETEREQHAQKEKEDAAKEKEVAAIQKKGGSYDVRIEDAKSLLQNHAQTLFNMQRDGLNAAAEKAAAFRRRLPPPKQESSLVEDLAWIALDLATEGIASRVQSALLKHLKGIEGGFLRGTEEVVIKNTSGYLPELATAVTGQSKSLEMSGSADTFSRLVGSTLKKGGGAIKNALKGKAHGGEGGPPATSVAETSGERIDFFTAQRNALNMAEQARVDAIIELPRALSALNNPQDAPKAAAILKATQDEFDAAQQEASRLQEEETTKAWARFVAQSSMGSVSNADAKSQDLAPAKDGGATAKISNAANGAGTYDGLLELELVGDVHHPERPVQAVRASLNGISTASARLLDLGGKPLASAGIPIRLRIRNEVLAVTIVRDEAGNIRFSDESGAVGMPTEWLHRRGGGAPGDHHAAERAAKKIMQEFTTKSLDQLGVGLELDDA